MEMRKKLRFIAVKTAGTWRKKQALSRNNLTSNPPFELVNCTCCHFIIISIDSGPSVVFITAVVFPAKIK